MLQVSNNLYFIQIGTPSPRKKRNNSTPTKKSNAAEKKQILQQLISPAATARPKVCRQNDSFSMLKFNEFLYTFFQFNFSADELR